MIAKLTGRVDSLADGSAVIDVGGVGYLVACSARGLAKMAEGSHVSLLIETQVREDAIHLYGFPDAEERRWFRLLIAIQGVGPKVALAMLGVAAPDALARAVAAGDRALFSRAAGVGAKLAARVVAELKDKVAILPAGTALPPGATEPASAGGVTADAVSALVNLGFRSADAQAAIDAAAARPGADLALEALIRAGLAALTAPESRA